MRGIRPTAPITDDEHESLAAITLINQVGQPLHLRWIDPLQFGRYSVQKLSWIERDT
jgi:hypothetical protein